MSLGADGGGASGVVQAFGTSGRGLNVDELADLALARIIVVADTAPQPIRDQAIAFREKIRPVLTHYLRQAARSDRVTAAAKLREAGQSVAADIILIG